MKNETLKQIIEQIKKYELTESFSDAEELKKWLLELNDNQINNFLSLDIDLEEIRELRDLLINSDLLNCQDYKQKVSAISTLKNGDGCWDLFSAICNPNFLKSEKFYKDIEMLSKADTARYGLWILGKDSFINSPYHDEDLKLLVETHDNNKEDPLDYVVSDALATVAGNIDSINSPHHRVDMKLIAIAGSDSLQMSNSYPEQSINNLAINKVSLKDKYHFENMQILAANPIAREFLYIIMTNPNFVNGINYRKEIEALANAKSEITARALYYYIVNPDKKYLRDRRFILEGHMNFLNDAYISDKNCIAGCNDPNYLDNLIRINTIKEEFVMHFVSLLMNPNFINSPYKDFDLHLLQSVSSKPIFMDLYRLMSDETTLSSIYHINDATIISQSTIDKIRILLLEKACNIYSLNSINHLYDMEFISKLNLDSLPEKIFLEIYYYLFNPKGIDDSQRQEKLERLLKGELVKRNSSVFSFLDTLQSQIDDSSSKIIESTPTVSCNPKSRILSLFKKNTKK